MRVKLWRPDGYVLWADEPQLVGRTFALDADQREALDGPTTVADVSTLDASENQFEKGDRLVEVYRPVWMPDGRTALFEIYVSYVPVSERTGQLWRGFAGVTASSLVLFVLIVTPLVLALLRRVRRAEARQVALLQRAVDASSAERRRIAASLHDGPVQELAATSFTVAGASATAASRGDTGLARDLGAAASAVRASIRSLRTLLVDLHPPSLSRAGIVAALGDLATSVRGDDVVVRLDTDPGGAARPHRGRPAPRAPRRPGVRAQRRPARGPGRGRRLAPPHRARSTVDLDVVDDGRGFDVEAVLADPEPGPPRHPAARGRRVRPGGGAAGRHGARCRDTLAARPRRPDGGARMIRVLVADDHQLVRAGVRTLLDAEPGHHGRRGGARRGGGHRVRRRHRSRTSC